MGAFKLGKMTFGSLFKKPETVQYPFEKKPQPAGLKGHVAIDVENCILCGMCERGCTTGCIKVDKKERYWGIQPFQCVQCGYCITVCPKNCLSMDAGYTPAAATMDASRYMVPEQPKEAKPTPKPAEKKPGKVEAAPAAANPEKRDAQVDALISLMDPERAAKAKAALS